MNLFVWMIEYEDGSEFADIFTSVDKCKEVLAEMVNEYNEDIEEEAHHIAMPNDVQWHDLVEHAKEMDGTVDSTAWHIIPIGTHRSAEIAAELIALNSRERKLSHVD